MLEVALRMRREEAEQFHSMVKMHLSFLLDLNTDDCDCSFLESRQETASHYHGTPSNMRRLFTTPSKRKPSKKIGVMDGAPLTMEGVCQIFQIIEFLSRNHNIVVEGIFRKHGSLKKQQTLKERLNRGVPMNLDEGDFSVHECAAVFKAFLSELPEPLLTDAYYTAHCQVTLLMKSNENDVEVKRVKQKQIQCLQLLFLLIPEANYDLLKDTLLFLKKVADHENSNKMSAKNLGTVFATHILCPRKLSAESLQSNHQLLTRSVTFMIENAQALFDLPPQLVTDIEAFWRAKDEEKTKSSATTTTGTTKRKPNSCDSPIVNTVFTFVNRDATQKVASESTTDTALAALYAHVQSMPESAQKKKLIQKLNDANGCGTPGASMSSTPIAKKSRLKPPGALKSLLLTPSRRSKMEGSYSLSTPFKTPTTRLNSFRRQTSETLPPTTPVNNQKLLSPQSSPAILVSPNTLENVVSPKIIGTPTGLKCPTVDLATPTIKKVPPVPPERISSLLSNGPSPITNCARKMPSDMQELLMTPRCRRPVMAGAEDGSGQSPCQPLKYNEDEPDSQMCDESDRYFEALEDEDDDEHRLSCNNSMLCDDRSLEVEFRKYLEEQRINDSAVSVSSSVISREMRDLVTGEATMSDSMRFVLDGNDPVDTVEPSVLEPVDVDEDFVDHNDENCLKQQNRKRRSLTENSECNPLSLKSTQATNNIYFETDL